MRHGATPRSAHRAAPDGGPALLVRRGPGTDRGPDLPRPRRSTSRPVVTPRQRVGNAAPRKPAGPAAHRPPPQRLVPREPQRTLQMLMSGLGALIVLGVCGLSGFFVVADERRGHGAAAASRTGDAAAIATRQLDARPLTLREVFPSPEIRPAPGAAPYAIGMTHNDTDCGAGATGQLRVLLSDHACSQVVRASMTAPYGGYRVTAGVFNLARAADAVEVGEQARQLVEAGRGTFVAMVAGGSATQPLAQVGWQERGHYLVYCVISRPDGGVVSDADQYARRITADLIESYLGGDILGRRASGA